jgi:polyhydroxyalkanoate synthesis regulator phasin
MLWLIGSWASDFEGFSTKDILFQTDDIDELRDYVKQKYNKSTWYDNEKYVDDLINGKETVESWAEFKNSKELQDLLDDYR